MKSRKGCGPYNLGAPKSAAKYSSPMKQTKVDPNLSESERELLNTDILSDARAQKLKGLRGRNFANMAQQMRQEQRAADSSYIVNNRTIKDLKPVKQSQGSLSSSLLSPQGESRPSKFKRDNKGNLIKY